ncbi:aminotransferase-like domain-containing protein [Shewanella surugensis]|uniref:PLP-dependent aminotransferase family protein n=1 Tax=Shewanella surugensis TaxID=212020 RepID=A0ABT0LDP4_9GAMM|nr:PLP-dependent aminotransferase family protein [Shewanella surugensis]MCL1125831.1 PLP-dependent aminotransferase family protein [Shewanella surugensis]
MSNNKFRHIAQTIDSRILEGLYPANTKLPPHRALADELGTTPSTIAKAYALLMEHDKVISFVGKGTFVCASSQLENVIQANGIEEEYNFSILQPCLIYNQSALQNAFQQSSQQMTTELMGYTDQSGHIAHKKAGAKWSRAFGLEVSHPQDILLASGAQNALDMLIQTYTQAGDIIAVEEYTYPGILSIAQLHGLTVVDIPMDEHGMRVDALEKALNSHPIKMVIILPSHQNPTTITMSISRRQAIATVLKQHQTWLIEDDLYGFLNEKVIPAITNFIPELSFHISGLSKAICPALRCAFIKTPRSEVRKVSACIRSSIWLASPFTFDIAKYLIDSGDAFKLVDTQKAIAKKRQAFAKIAFSFLTHYSHNTSYHMWIALPAHWRSETLLMETKDRHLLVSSGSFFTHATQQASVSTQYIRLSLMAISNENHFQQGILQLAALIKEDPKHAFLPLT